MKNISTVFAIFVLMVFTFSCDLNSKPKGFDYGRVENNKYTNSFFNLEVNLPPKWIVQTKEQTDNLVEKSKNIVAGDNKNLKAMINASEVNSANLLAIFQYEVGSPVEYNPNLMMVAENLKLTPGIKTGSDYLYQARKLIKQSQIHYDSIDEEFKKVMIGNQEFYVMKASLSYAGLTIRQEYYSTIANGFGVSTIISYVTDEQKDILTKVIHSMKFNK